MKPIKFKTTKHLSIDIWKTGKNNIKTLRKVFLLHLFMSCVNYKKVLMKIQTKKKKSLKLAGKKFLPLLETILKKIPNKYLNLNRKIRIYKYLKRKSRQLFQKEDRIVNDLIFILENKRGKSFARMTPYAHALKLRRLVKYYYGNVKLNSITRLVRTSKYYLANLPKSDLYTINKFNNTNFIKMMESRLDKVLLDSFFGYSIRQTKQLLNHGDIMVNGRVIKIPSYFVKEGDIITLRNINKLYVFFYKKLIKHFYFLFTFLYNSAYIEPMIKSSILMQLKNNVSSIEEETAIIKNNSQYTVSNNFISSYNNTIGFFSFFQPFPKNILCTENKALFLKKTDTTFEHVLDKTNVITMLNWLNK